MNDSTSFNKLTTPENWGEYKIKSLKKTKEEILFLCGYQLKVTAQVAFLVGQRLIAMKATLEHGKFIKWLDEEFPLTQRTARRYMAFYEGLKLAQCANLDGLTMTEALMAAGIIEPKKPQLENAAGLNRIDLGGDPGQLNFDYGELFGAPATTNRALKSYRTIATLLTEIIVVHRTKDGLLTSKRIAHFCEDVPKEPALRMAYKDMAHATQAAIEKYLAVVEQEEEE